MIICSTFWISCQKEECINRDQNLITEEFVKIETQYEEGCEKIETSGSLNDCDQITYAPFSYKEEIRSSLEQSFSKTSAYMKSTGEHFGVFKNGKCGKYRTLSVYLDNEDKNCGTNSSGWKGNSYTNRNTTLQFCIINDVSFERLASKGFAVLSLSKHASTSDLPYGVTRVKRYFDDEDNNNTSSAKLEGMDFKGWI